MILNHERPNERDERKMAVCEAITRRKAYLNRFETCQYPSHPNLGVDVNKGSIFQIIGTPLRRLKFLHASIVTLSYKAPFCRFNVGLFIKLGSQRCMCEEIKQCYIFSLLYTKVMVSNTLTFITVLVNSMF